jgi:hypothetical protein
MTTLSYGWIRCPLQASLCELLPGMSLESQPSAHRNDRAYAPIINPPVKSSFTNRALRTFSLNPMIHIFIAPLFPAERKPYGPEANCERSKPVYGFLPPNPDLSG